MRQIRNASDTTCKQLLRDEECFADLCNYAFFQLYVLYNNYIYNVYKDGKYRLEGEA